MEVHNRILSLGDNRLASRKAEEAALRRYRAAGWLDSMVGPLNLPRQPSEADFVSCLRNGIILCNLINKIQPGAIPRVVHNHSMRFNHEAQPPPAYQYFENIRNFLVAVEEMKLPAFESSDLEKEALDSGSTSKIVDCVLALKSFHEWKSYNGGNKFSNYTKSPVVLNPPCKFSSSESERRKRLDLISVGSSNNQQAYNEDLLVEALCDHIFRSKENVDHNTLAPLLSRLSNPGHKVAEMIASLRGEQKKRDSSPEKKAVDKTLCKHDKRCNHRQILEAQEKELGELKVLLSDMKADFLSSQSQLESDLSLLGSQIQGLSFSALRYSRAMKENRSLYNTLQDLRGNIRVYCRIRPSLEPGAISSIELGRDNESLTIIHPSKPKDEKMIFQFNKVFGGTASQEEVYKDTQPLIRSVMDGFNVCIFAYGQTGSGKTHTMFGGTDGSGVIHCALHDLYQISSSRSDCIKYEIKVQMIEIYNDQARDLLGDDPTAAKVEIRSCSGDGGMSIPEAALHTVSSPEDIKRLMRVGQSNRAKNCTALNQTSSGSHSVLTVHVHGEEVSGGAVRGRLYLVDLAGSERVGRSEVTGDRLREAQHINSSLSCLGDMMAALGQKSSHVPYRSCKLTQLLQDSLGGQAKTLMLAHISPDIDSYEETVSTLRFAQRVSRVELGAAKRNKESSEVRKLTEQVESLKRAIAMRSEVTPCRKSQKIPLRSRRLSLECGRIPNKSPLPQAKISELRSAEDLRARTLHEEAATTSDSTPDPVSSSIEIQVPGLNGGSRSASKNPDRSSNHLRSSRNYLRKSLQTFGRTINGEIRNDHQKPREKKPIPALSPCSVPAGARAARRQSLIQIPSPRNYSSRRSSLGGKPTPAVAGKKKTTNAANQWL
ncbi:kinesin-like protein KIN-14A isoform X2 [Wolffia australiana]